MKQVPLYQKYADSDSIAVFLFSNHGGVEILDFEHGRYRDFSDCAIACYNFGTGRQKIRRHKVETSDSGRSFIRMDGTRYYLDEM